MPTYTCDKCARTFKQKSGFDDHKAKKIDCSQNTVLNTVIESKVKEVVKSLLPKKVLELPSDPIKRDAILQDYFKRLHDILWDRAGFNPEKAMEHLIFFFAYRLIEKQAEVLSLPQECRWSFLSSKTNENDRYEIMKKGCIAFQKNPTTKPFFKKPEIDKVDIVFDIIEHINMIPDEAIDNTDTLGNIFEYMQSWGWATMGTNGQYFTNRSICRLAFTLAYRIKGTLKRPDGSLCTFADWFCGTGGFPAEYIKGVNTHLPTIDWKTQSKSICCQDQSVSSVATTLLNLLIMTGHPFTERVKQGNSFSDPITTRTAPFAGYAIDYLFLNPPYAGSAFVYSKSVKDEAGNKTKKFYVNEEIQSIGIEDDVKVSAGTQLAMATLSHEGVCCIVLPQGFFFGSGKKCIELRKKIAEEYKIWYVIDIASGSFLNTGTKTSMVVFQKSVGPTEKVAFIGLDEKPLVEATLEELRSKNYSLNYKQYISQSSVEVEGFKMVKLGDIVKPASMKHRSTPEGNKIGKYPLISSALDVEYYMDTYDSETPSLIFNTINADGNCSVHYYERFNVTSNTYVLSGSNKVTLQYIYYYLKTQPELLKSCFEGTTKKALSRPLLQSIDIPTPSLERQQQIVEAIDGWAELAKQEDVALKILEKQVMFQVKEMGCRQTRVKLGEVCDIKCGKPMPKTDIVDGDVPVIGGGVSPMGFHNVSTHGAYTPIVSQRGTAGHVSRYSSKTWITPNAVIPVRKDASVIMNDDMLFYILKNEQWSIDNIVEKTAQPLLTIGNLKNIEIRAPPLAEQQTLQSDFDEIRHKHAKIANYKEKVQEAIRRLIPVTTGPVPGPVPVPAKIPFKINKPSS